MGDEKIMYFEVHVTICGRYGATSALPDGDDEQLERIRKTGYGPCSTLGDKDGR